MKLFRINRIEEFFNIYPKALDILGKAEKSFTNTTGEPVKKITIPMQINFEGVMVNLIFNLKCIVFEGDHELYYYDVLD
jgi:hypothetical protein